MMLGLRKTYFFKGILQGENEGNLISPAFSKDALALTLSGVKLLMTNFPFFYSCFLTNLVETKCGTSFEEAG